ncbi:MAG: squalene synthase HpnC [Pirellula sp.]|nr:squalene synthase HpnC [Pirellula sp.]
MTEAIGLAAAQDYCRRLTKKHYENFSVASRLVPSGYRQHLANVYSFCRWADDLADEIGSTEESMGLLNWWRESLQRCYAGDCRHPVFVSLQNTIQQFQIPIEPFEKLIDAFCDDQVKFRYETDQEILRYCSGSANPVGRILLYMVGEHNNQTTPLSDSICSGLQIANFCQDVRRDATRGRIYLPKTYWDKHELCESSILSGGEQSRLRRALSEWATLARGMLRDGLPLVTLVPLWLARDLQLFVRGGLYLLDELERNDYDSWTKSIEVSKVAKLKLIFRAWFSPRSFVP